MKNGNIRLILIMTALIMAVGSWSAVAIAQEAEVDSTTTVSAETPPPPAKVSAPSKAGPFAKGRKRVGFYGGAGSFYNQTYVILGAGLGYYLADGLEIGIDVEGWVAQSPTIWKFTPQLRYVVWQMGNLKPYLGAFYRWNSIGDPFEDYNSYGGRLGVAYQSGRSYVALGAVYEVFDEDKGTDSSVWYPEIAFWISF